MSRNRTGGYLLVDRNGYYRRHSVLHSDFEELASDSDTSEGFEMPGKNQTVGRQKDLYQDTYHAGSPHSRPVASGIGASGQNSLYNNRRASSPIRTTGRSANRSRSPTPRDVNGRPSSSPKTRGHSADRNITRGRSPAATDTNARRPSSTTGHSADRTPTSRSRSPVVTDTNARRPSSTRGHSADRTSTRRNEEEKPMDLYGPPKLRKALLPTATSVGTTKTAWTTESGVTHIGGRTPVRHGVKEKTTAHPLKSNYECLNYAGEMENYRRKHDELNENTSKAEYKLKKKQNQLDQLQKAVQSEEEELKNLQRQRKADKETLTNQRNQSPNTRHDRTLTRGSIVDKGGSIETKLKKEIGELDTKYTLEKYKSRSEIVRAEKEAFDANQKNARLMQDLEDKEQEITNLLEKQDETVAVLEERLRKTKSELKEANEQNKNLRQRLHTHPERRETVTTVSEGMQNLELQLKAKEKDTKQLRERLEKQDETVAVLEERLRKTKSELKEANEQNKNLRQRLHTHPERRETVTTVSEGMQNLELQLKAKEKDTKQLRERLEEKQAEHKTALARVGRLEQELYDAGVYPHTRAIAQAAATTIQPQRFPHKDGDAQESKVFELWAQIRSLQDDLEECKTSKRQVEHERVASREEVSKLREDVSNKRTEIRRLQEEKSTMEKESSRIIEQITDRKKYSYEDAKLQRQLREKCEELKELEQQSVALKQKKNRQIADLTERLSMEMESKISADESNLENISIRSRPTNIATEYELLCSDHWLGAKKALDDYCTSMPEDDKFQLLCKVLMIGLEEANKSQKLSVEVISYLIQNPGSRGQELDSTSPRRATSDVRVEIMNSLGNLLRLNSDVANVRIITQNIKGKTKRDPHISNLRCSSFDKYLEAVARLAWKMTIQRPPMTFDKSGEGQAWQGHRKQDLFWTSSDPEDDRSRVKFYIHPALYHGDMLMVKGRVLLDKNR